MLSPSRPARSPTRSPDTNGQSKLRHYEVPGAEVTPRYGATHHFGAAATIHGRETPLERKGPLLRVPGRAAGPEGHRKGTYSTNLTRLLLTFAKITPRYARATLKNDETKFNNDQN